MVSLQYVCLASLVRMHPQRILNITWDGREGGFQNLIKLKLIALFRVHVRIRLL